MRARASYPVLLAFLLLALPVAILIAAGTGAYPILPWRIPAILWSQLGDEGYAVLVHIRFPRVLLAVLAGGALGVSGACLQALFRNPLADPGLIGVSSGAALGAAGWIVLAGAHTLLGVWGLPLAAFAGGLLAVWLVWRIAHIAGRLHTATLLLTGIALNSLAIAGIGLLVFVSDEEELRGLSFWQLGSLGGIQWPVLFGLAPIMLLGMALLLPAGQALNALALGEREAFHLGLSVRRVQRQILIGAALAVGAAVAAVGGVGFVGLLVPHLIRMASGADNRWVIPASGLAGALLLLGADAIARTAVQPAELPVGILTALLGGPFFLGLLLRHKGALSHA